MGEQANGRALLADFICMTDDDLKLVGLDDAEHGTIQVVRTPAFDADGNRCGWQDLLPDGQMMKSSDGPAPVLVGDPRNWANATDGDDCGYIWVTEGVTAYAIALIATLGPASGMLGADHLTEVNGRKLAKFAYGQTFVIVADGYDRSVRAARAFRAGLEAGGESAVIVVPADGMDLADVHRAHYAQTGCIDEAVISTSYALNTTAQAAQTDSGKMAALCVEGQPAHPLPLGPVVPDRPKVANLPPLEPEHEGLSQRVAEAKRVLTVRDVYAHLTGGAPVNGAGIAKCVRAQDHAHGDRTPSLSLFAPSGFRCFGCGVKGDHIDLIEAALGCDTAEAMRRFAEMAGIPEHDEPASKPAQPDAHSTPAKPAPRSARSVRPRPAREPGPIRDSPKKASDRNAARRAEDGGSAELIAAAVNAAQTAGAGTTVVHLPGIGWYTRRPGTAAWRKRPVENTLLDACDLLEEGLAAQGVPLTSQCRREMRYRMSQEARPVCLRNSAARPDGGNAVSPESLLHGCHDMNTGETIPGAVFANAVVHVTSDGEIEVTPLLTAEEHAAGMYGKRRDHVFTVNGLSYAYNPKPGATPMFDSLLRMPYPDGGPEGGKPMRDLHKQLLGMMLARDGRAQILPVLAGPMDTGKSQYTTLAYHLAGGARNAARCQTLAALDSLFAGGCLPNTAVIIPDLPHTTRDPREQRALAALKAATGGEPAEEAAPMFFCTTGRTPGWAAGADGAEAWRARMVLLPWNNPIADSGAERVYNMGEAIYRKEAPDVAAKALHAYAAVLASGRSADRRLLPIPAAAQSGAAKCAAPPQRRTYCGPA